MKKNFKQINIGDPEYKVLTVLGEPSVREYQTALFSRYASIKCKEPCVARLWFENILSFNIEAWSIELDKEGYVIRKSYWVSP